MMVFEGIELAEGGRPFDWSAPFEVLELEGGCSVFLVLKQGGRLYWPACFEIDFGDSEVVVN